MKNKRGDGYIGTCVMILILCMILSIFIEFVATVNVKRISERNARIVLDSFVMENSIEIYDSIKTGTDFTEVVDVEQYISKYSEYNSLDFNGNMLYCCGDDGEELYRQTIPTVQLIEENRLKIIAEYTITVPLYFAGQQVTEVTVPITATSKFNPKF